jgi:hypothetical protein
MTELAVRFPASPAVTVAGLLDALAGEPTDGPLSVGDDRILDFLGRLARRLLAPSVARRHPELGSLGFFLRRGELTQALDRLRSGPPGRLRFPRGLVFHIPPANVDTIFVYSWALSALAGNRNVVRLSARAGAAAAAAVDALNAALADAHPAVGQTQRMVTYGRAADITARLSKACDLRVIWGGDDAVNAIRGHPLRPSARDLTFPDRASFAAVSVAGWRAATPAERRAAVAAFATDAYWFDQAACASPRAVYWIGAEPAAAAARTEFDALLAAAVRDRGWTVDAAMAVRKRVGAYGVAADGAATAIRFVADAVTTLDLADPAEYPRRWLGTGTFAHATLGALGDLVHVVRRQDQTLTHFGFPAAELYDLAAAFGGRGIDRLVPFGSALTFTAVWDGYDLLHEFTKITSVTH